MKQVLLYGDSIFLNGLAAQLQDDPNLDVRHHTLKSGPLQLGEIDVVILDLDEVQARDVMTILRARSNLKVVGVNAPSGAVTVLSGKIYLAHTLADVVNCLE